LQKSHEVLRKMKQSRNVASLEVSRHTNTHTHTYIHTHTHTHTYTHTHTHKHTQFLPKFGKIIRQATYIPLM